MKPWYEELFENYALKYDQESFAQGTVGECDFIEKEIGYEKSTRILDIGCGTGRHSIELAQRGYTIIGIDLSASLLKRAEEKALQRNIKVDFQKLDARKLTFTDEFDLVIMLCEGAFSLMETDEMNFQILRNAAQALKAEGKLILTTLNGLFPLRRSVTEFINSQAEEGNSTYESRSFDPMTFRDHGVVYCEDDFGNRKALQCNERYYTPPEMVWLLKTLNFDVIDIYARPAGTGDQVT